MKIIVDVGVGKLSDVWLSQQGHDMLATRDINPHMGDDEISEIAVREERLAITMDKDFGELVYKNKAAHAGVLWPRLEDATGAKKVQVLSEIFLQHRDKLLGCFCVYNSGRLRIHPR